MSMPAIRPIFHDHCMSFLLPDEASDRYTASSAFCVPINDPPASPAPDRWHAGCFPGSRRSILIRFAVFCLLYALSVMLAARVVPGLRVKSFGGAVVFAAVFGILDGLLFSLLAI